MAKATAATARKTCFVISPIDKPGSPVRERADTLLDYIIKPVLEADGLGFSVERADEIQQPGLITQQVMERVVVADLVVADLTGRNANVFYELALRHAARKPAIHMIQGDEAIPFDVANQRTICYDVDVRHAEQAKKQLEEQTKAVLADPSAADNPISATMQLLRFGESQDPTKQGIARVLAELSAIRAMLTPAASTAWTQDANRYFQALGTLARRDAFTGGMTGIPTYAGERAWLPSATFVSQVGQALGKRRAVPTICEKCGQPITGACYIEDNYPVHMPGECPPPITPKGTPTT